MKRAVLCVTNPQDYIDQLDGYSLMIINPAATDARKQYLLDQADWSLKITEKDHEVRSGGDYGNERLFWYTSGTTGDSKFCSFTQAQLDLQAQTICKAYDISANDRYVSIMPLWHAHGQGFYWATRRAQCEQHFVTVRNLRDMTQYSPTFVTAVPDILKVIGHLDLGHLRFIRGASSAMPDQLYQDLSTRYGVPVIEAFGMTEALSHCFTNPLHGEQRMGTVGLPDGIEADIQDGQLWIKGATVFQDGWFNTGDLAEQDSAGYYRILGRLKDRINIRGYKFDPASLERQLLAVVPGLSEVAVFGDRSVNCVYVGDCTDQAIQQALIQLHADCRPRYLEKVATIPVGPSGKISRSWLVQQFNPQPAD